MRGSVVARVIVLSVAGGLLCLPAPFAGAAFPGSNGKIAYDSGADGDVDIYVVNPDGTGKAKLTLNSDYDANPVWSPDGSRIAFVCCARGSEELWVMSATGSSRAQLTDGTGAVRSAAWSPDGSKIAYNREYCRPGCSGLADAYQELWVVNADASDATKIRDAGFALEPSWSPDGTEIAIGYVATSELFTPSIATVQPDGSNLRSVTSNSNNCFEYAPDWSPDTTKLVFEGDNELFTINRNGTGQSQPCPSFPGHAGESPVWSPDGTKLAFLHRPSGDNWEIHLANTDFTNEQDVTEIAPQGVNPGPPRGLDWQPVPINYPRPKGATPTQVSLVPAYAQCISPNRTHGPPLAFPSCASPTQTSDELTVGTADSNGKATKSRGLVRYDTVVGNPSTPADEADVQITVELSDVYEQGTLADYTGELRARTSLRITDKLNTPNPGGPGAATVSDASLGATVPCVATADTTEGASCNLVTTFDALVPGTVTESKRSIWALGAAQLDDGGADNDADTPGDNTLFMTQGVFIP